MHHILRKNYRKGCHYRLSIKTIKFQEINWKNYDNYESSYKTVKRSAYGYQIRLTKLWIPAWISKLQIKVMNRDYMTLNVKWSHERVSKNWSSDNRTGLDKLPNLSQVNPLIMQPKSSEQCSQFFNRPEAYLESMNMCDVVSCVKAVSRFKPPTILAKKLHPRCSVGF